MRYMFAAIISQMVINAIAANDWPAMYRLCAIYANLIIER